MGAVNEGKVVGIITEGETVGAVNEGKVVGIITEGETVGVGTEGIVVEAAISEKWSAGTASGLFTSNQETYSRSYKSYCSSYLVWNKASCSCMSVKVFVEGDSTFPTAIHLICCLVFPKPVFAALKR